MYYSDHLALAEKEITSSNFCCLVDAAVMLYEEEEQERKSHTTKKKTETENDMSFFHVFPRKPRTPVKKSVASRKNPNSSSPSLLLGDCKIMSVSETRNPRKPPFSFSSVLSLGDYKITAESEKRNPQNPNSFSSSSSPEKRNQRNPNSESETENKSRKRRAVQERSPSGCRKKPKIEAFSWIGRETPNWLLNLMRDMNGTELCLIFERSLYKTDVNPKESRLSMPFNELIKKDFLKPKESRIMEEDINNDKKIGVGAILFDQERVKWGVMLKRWEMKRDSGNGSWNFALTCGWNDIVEANGLKLDDRISIWSFRWNGLLCFALVTLPSIAQTSSSSSSLALCL